MGIVNHTGRCYYQLPASQPIRRDRTYGLCLFDMSHPQHLKLILFRQIFDIHLYDYDSTLHLARYGWLIDLIVPVVVDVRPVES